MRENIMGAWSKLFSDASIVTSTTTVKQTNGKTCSAKLNVGAVGLTDKAFAEASKLGATLSESLKVTLPDGSVKTKKNVIKSEDITPSQAHGAVCDLIGYAEAARPTKGGPVSNAAAAADAAV